MKRLHWGEAIQALKETIRTSAMIFIIMIGANIFGYFMTMSQIPQHLVAVVTEMNINRWIIIIGITVGYFVISMFMDEIPLLLLTLPLTFPLVVSVGFDPVWFGVLSTLMVAMGLVFPPVGMVAFVIAATTKVDLMKVYRGTGILIIAIFITTALVMIFPEIALWLPSTMRKGVREAGISMRKERVATMLQIDKKLVEVDVLIAGGGIAGLMAGIRAAGEGVSVAVVEKANTKRSGSGATGNDHFCCYIPEVHGDDLGPILWEDLAQPAR